MMGRSLLGKARASGAQVPPWWPDWLIRANLTAAGGGSAALPLALLAQARIFIDWSDAANRSRRFARNQNAPVPSNNLIAFPTGPIVNEAGTATPTKTNFYSGAVDPGGTNNATRLVSTGANQVFYLVRSGAGPMPPAGTYTLRFRARANNGTGPWTINYGQATGYASGSAQDLDWANSANEAATTFTATFTYNGSTDIAIRLAASGADVLIDRVQLYEGSSVPAWSSEVFGGGRLPYAFTNSLTLTAQNGVDQTGVPSGFSLIDPAFPARHTYTGYTWMTVSSLDAVPTGPTHIINQHVNEGGSSTGNVLYCEGGAPYSGEVNGYATTLSRQFHAFNVAGDGVFIAGQGRSATERFVWADTVPAHRDSLAFAPVDISRWTVGGWSSSSIAGARSFLAPGDYHFNVIWDRLLTPAEFAAVGNYLRSLVVARAVPNLLPFTDYHVISGDSNGTRATNDWTQLVSADGFFAPQRNLLMSDTSVGGQGIDDIERNWSGGESGLPQGTITDNGRFRKKDAPALLYGCDNGRYALYHLPIGTNDWDILNNYYTGTDAQKASAYCAQVQALIAAALAVHSRVHVLWYSLLPQTSTSRPNWETQRLLVNSEMRTWIAAQSRVHICDVGGSATLGSRALQAGGGGTYYQSDEIHLNSAGDIEFAAIHKAAVQAWRSALGIA